MNKKIQITLATLLLSSGITFAATNYNYETPATTTTPVYQPNYYLSPTVSPTNGTLKGRVVTVPAGEAFSAVVTTPLNSSTLTLGQSVSMALGSDFYYNGNLIAPAGSSVTGNVLEVSRAKHGSMNGKLSVRFTQIVTPYGIQIPISAVIKTEDNSGVLIGGTKTDVVKDYGKDLVAGSAAGALSGVVFGALAGGNIGKGAALGTAVGAGGGLIKSIWDKGDDVEIPASARVDLLLTQPITVNPASYSQN